MCEQVTDFNRSTDALDSREHLNWPKFWWKAEVQSDVHKIIDPYWFHYCFGTVRVYSH